MAEQQQSDDEDAVPRVPPELDDDGAEPVVVPRPGAPSIPMDPPEHSEE